MLCSNTFQTRVFPQPASLDRQGTPVLHQLARENKKPARLDGSIGPLLRPE